MNNEKREYTTPQLTVVSFKAERGYAVSGTPLTGFLELFDSNTSESQTQESWTEHDTWNSSGDNFF